MMGLKICLVSGRGCCWNREVGSFEEIVYETAGRNINGIDGFSALKINPHIFLMPA